MIGTALGCIGAESRILLHTAKTSPSLLPKSNACIAGTRLYCRGSGMSWGREIFGKSNMSSLLCSGLFFISSIWSVTISIRLSPQATRVPLRLPARTATVIWLRPPPQQNMLQHKQAAKRFRTYFNKKRAKLPFLVLGWFLFLMQAYHVDDVKKSAVFGIGGLILVSLVVHFEQFGTKWVKRVRMAENIAMICAMLCYLCRCGCPCDPWLTDILLWGLPITTFVCVWLFHEEKE